MRLRHRCLLLDFAKLLRTPFFSHSMKYSKAFDLVLVPELLAPVKMQNFLCESLKKVLEAVTQTHSEK